MEGAGLYCEGVKGECNFGQQEIAFRYAEALETADNHTIYKNGAKEIADAHGKSLTFMAKFNEREGNSCHIHLSVRDADGAAVMAGDGQHGFSPFMEQWNERAEERRVGQACGRRCRYRWTPYY